MDKNRSIEFNKLLQQISDHNIIGKELILNLVDEHRDLKIIYTPNEISKLMAEIGKLFNPKTVLDPACGTGNLLSYCGYAEKIQGFDINDEILQIAKIINPEITFHSKDFIISDVSYKYNLIISHFPFGERRRINNRSYPIEQLFIEKSLSLLSKRGTLICLMPNTFLTAPIYKATREFILDKYSLELIINLPLNVLSRYIPLCSIVAVRNRKQTKKVLLALYESSLYENNANEIIDNYNQKKGEFLIKRNKLIERWDRKYFDPRFREIEHILEGKEVDSLENIAELNIGCFFKTDQKKSVGKYLIVTPKHIRLKKIKDSSRDSFADEIDVIRADEIDVKRFQRCILKTGDILVNLVPRANDEILYHYKEDDPPAVINHNCAIIRSKKNPYIISFLQTPKGKKCFQIQTERESVGGGVLSHLNISQLKRIKIPIIPIENLNLVSDERIENSSLDELNSLKEELETLLQKDFITKELYGFLKERSIHLEQSKSNRFFLNQPVTVEETRHYEFG